ncbi:hypothetical protein [Streptomyces broussonetiae]|uniref:hypothetical protein n=1 Tax=Streptomyces broussonetiae TaxID=2686304 RepID=UPI001E5572CA|nr:hypothetical protein [Streptomyces broussonetiae]
MDAGAVTAALEDARSKPGTTRDTRAWPTTSAARRSLRSGSASRSCSTPQSRAPPTTRTPTVVQAELVADAAAAAREAALRETARIAARADELQALRELGALEQTEPRDGDEAVRNELTRRAGGYVQTDVDSWLAHALATHLGHYRDPAAREAAAGLLTPSARGLRRAERHLHDPVHPPPLVGTHLTRIREYRT